jgi:hypothetical protein
MNTRAVEESARMQEAMRYEARLRDEVAVGILPKLVNYSPTDSAREGCRKAAVREAFALADAVISFRKGRQS